MDGDINVRIVADSSSFMADVQKAAEAAKTSFSQIENSAQEVGSQTRVSSEQIRTALAEMGVDGVASARQLEEALKRITGAAEQARVSAASAPTAAPAASPAAASAESASALTFSSQSVRDAIGDVTRMDATLKSAEASARVFGTSVGASATEAAERLGSLSQASVVTSQSIQSAISAATGLGAANSSAAESASVFERALGTQSERAAELRDRNSSLAAATKVSSEATRDAIDRVTGISGANKSAAESASVFESALGTQAQRATQLRQAMLEVAPAQAQASSAAQQAASAMGGQGQKAAELRAQLAVAQQQLAQFNRELHNLASAPAGTPGLNEALSQTAAAAEQSRARVRDLTNEMQALAPASEHAGTVSHGAMREMVVLAREAGRGDFTRMAGSATILADRLNLLKYVMNPVGLGIAAVGGAMVLATISAEETDRALGRMQAGLEASGRGAEFNEERFRKLIETLRQLPGVSKSGAVEMLEDFSRQSHLSVDEYEALGQAAAGYARITGDKVVDAQKELLKAIEGGSSKLLELNARYHFLSPAQLQAIEEAEKHADKVKAQGIAIDALKEKMAGLASSGLTPMEQAEKNLSNAWNRFTGDMEGTIPVAARLQAALTGVLNLLNGIGDKSAAAGRAVKEALTNAGGGNSVDELGRRYSGQLPAPRRSVPTGSTGSAGDAVKTGDGGKAVGMFQLHEAAAQDAGLSSSDRYDYNKNLYGGSAYFLQRLKAQGGDLDAATRAYNEGDGNLNSAKGYKYQSDVAKQNVAAMNPEASADIDAIIDQNFRGVSDAVRTRIKQIAMQESGGGYHYDQNTPRETSGGQMTATPPSGQPAGGAVDRHDAAAAANAPSTEPDHAAYDRSSADLEKIDNYLKQQKTLQEGVATAQKSAADATGLASQYEQQAVAADQAGDTERAASLRKNAEAARATATEAVQVEREKQGQLDDLHRTGELSRMQVFEANARKEAREQGNLLHENETAYADYWQHVLDTERLTAAEREQIEQRIVHARESAQRQGLQEFIAAKREEQAAARDHGEKVLEIEEQILARMRQLHLQGTREYEAELRHQEQLKRQYGMEAARDSLADINEEIRAHKQSTREFEQDEQLKLAAHQISHSQMIADMREREQADTAASIAALRKFQEANQQYPQEVKKARREIEQITAESNARIAQLDRQAAQQAIQSWEEAISPIESGFDGMISSLASGQETIGQAAAKAAASVIEEYAKMGLKAAFHWIAAQLGMTTATTAGETARTGATAAGAATREALTATEGSQVVPTVARAVSAVTAGEATKTTATAAGAVTREAVTATEGGSVVPAVAKAVAAVTAGEATKTAATMTGATTREAVTATESRGGIFSFLRSVWQWVAGEGTKTAATEAGVATRTATQMAGAKAGSAVEVASGTSSIMNSAYKAAAGAYSAVAGIPYIGPILAPAAAAVAFAGVMAFNALTSFDVGSWSVPHDQVAQVHADEMILPAREAKAIRSATKGQDFGGVVAAVQGGAPAYAVGAWDLPEDQLATVHKGEMIIPAAESAQVRAGLGRGSFGDVVDRVKGAPAGDGQNTPGPDASPPAVKSGGMMGVIRRLVGGAAQPAGQTLAATQEPTASPQAAASTPPKAGAPAPTAAPKLPGYAVGSWELDRDHVAEVHKGEMIVPAKQSAAIRASAPSAGFSGLADRIAATPAIGGAPGGQASAPGASLSDLIQNVNASFSVPRPSVPSAPRELAMAGGTTNSSSFKMGDMNVSMPVTGGPGGLNQRDLERAFRGMGDRMKGEILDTMRNGRLKLPGR